MIFKYIFTILILLQITFLNSQTISKLDIEIEKIKNDPDLKSATWSICIMPIEKDTILAEYNSSISLIPASTLKIVTTGASLLLLGSDFKFETRLQYDGIFDTLSGTIKGNLYIIGGGDPSIDSEYFANKNDSLSASDKWARILQKNGIKTIEGSIIADASIFENNLIPSQWIWADIGNYFGAGASGLSYHDNKYSLYMKSGAIGSKVEITKKIPEIKGLELINNVTSNGEDDNAFIYGAPYSFFREIQGTIPAHKNNYEIEGSMPDPALFCAQSLEHSLNKIGIKCKKESTTNRILKEEAKIQIIKKYNLHTHYSPPLKEIIYWTNYKSNNMYAEHLLKYIAYKKNGIGKENLGTEMVTKLWGDKGVDINGFFMTDGSGLSRSNGITTKTEAQILRLMANERDFKIYYESFPIAGLPGPLDNFCEGTFAQDNLRAKSGYIERVRGYAGYIKSKKGKLLCFSFLINNYDCTPEKMKKKIEKLLIAIPYIE